MREAHTLVVKLAGTDEAIRGFLSDHPTEPSKVDVKGGRVSVQIEISAESRWSLDPGTSSTSCLTMPLPEIESG